MTPLLLVAALLLAAPQENRPEEARRLYFEALDRRAELDLDSDLALLRAAHDADLSSLSIHIEYIHTAVARMSGALAQLRTEYAALPDSPLILCLRAYVAVSQENLPAAAPSLMAMAEGGEGGSCPPVLLAMIAADLKPALEWEARRLEYLERALVLEPDMQGLWTDFASALAASGRVPQAEDVLRRAAAAGWAHPLQRIRLNMRRAGLMQSRGDTTSANALRRAVRVAVERDGRPGVELIYLRELDSVIRTPNTPGNEFDDVLRRQAELARAHGAWSYEWLARYALAMRLTDRGEPLPALVHYDRVVEVADSVGIARYQVQAYYKRGKALERLGRLAEAEADLLRAVDLGLHAESDYYLAEAYHNLFHLYDSAGRQDEAARAVDRFIQTVQPLFHSSLQMTAWLDAGEFRWKAGWHAAANKAYAGMISVIDAQDEYHAYAGEYFERAGDLTRARAYYRRGVEASGASSASVRSLNLAGLARVFLAVGQLDSAEVVARAHDAAIAGSSDTPLLPEILFLKGEYPEAIHAAEEWARHRLAGGSAEAISTAYLRLADLLIQAGEPAKAIPPLDRADTLAGAVNLTAQHIESLRLRGLALTATGDTARGLQSLHLAAELALEHPTTLSIRATQEALADLFAALGRLEPALAAYERAVAQVETTTSSLNVDFDRVRHRNSNLKPYDGAIAALLAAPDGAGRDRTLLQWSGRRKAAALDVATLGLTRAVGTGWWDTEVSLGVDGHVFIDYLVSGKEVAALVLREGRVSLQRLPLPVDSVSSLTTRLRAPLTATSGGRVDLARARFDVSAARELYRALWEPLVDAIGDADRVLVAPDGPLHRVPFVALVSTAENTVAGGFSGMRFVLDDFEIEYTPSARYLGRGRSSAARARSGPARLLVVAYEAPGADAEVRAISRIWADGWLRTVTADEATESAVRGIESEYDILHYAAHAVADDRDPLASNIRLRPDTDSDGLYHLSEISSRRHEQELVVLSGCETQMGRSYAGEGLMGLTRAFLASGAHAVVATQWPVGPATVPLMKELYRGLARGEDPGAALRAAQLTLRSTPETAHPFYWAGFVLHRRD